MKTLPKLVILDRDGVINEDPGGGIRSAADWVPIVGSLEAIARLNHSGISVAVATNQSGIGRGLFGMDELNAIHLKFRRLLARVGGHVDGIFFCPHRPEAHCECRKPAPGLLRSISLRFGLPLHNVPFIGDSKRDIEAAHAARAIPMMVRTGAGNRTYDEYPDLRHLPWFDDLSGAVASLLNEAQS